MNEINYREMSKPKLVLRCEAYSHAIHQLANKVQPLQIENQYLRKRLDLIERNRTMFDQVKGIVVILLFVSSLAMACPKGTEPWEGGCASMPSPDESALAPVVAISTEKAPSDKMPSYERAGVKAAMPPSCASQDAKADQEKADADKQGKHAAGVPVQVGE